MGDFPAFDVAELAVRDFAGHDGGVEVSDRAGRVGNGYREFLDSDAAGSGGDRVYGFLCGVWGVSVSPREILAQSEWVAADHCVIDY